MSPSHEQCNLFLVFWKLVRVSYMKGIQLLKICLIEFSLIHRSYGEMDFKTMIMVRMILILFY